MTLRYGPEVATGFEPMDEEHRELFELLGDAIASARVASPEMVPKVCRLCDAIGAHFASEESQMKERGFAGLDAHAQAHRTFLADIVGLCEAAAEGKASLVLIWLESRFTSWVKLHTISGDRVFAAFLSQQVAAAPAASPGAAPVAAAPRAQ